MKPEIQKQIAPEVEDTGDPEQQWVRVSLFGGSAKQIAVGQNADTHLKLFCAGTYNDLYSRWQMVRSGLLRFAQTRFPNDSAYDIAVVRNKDGRLLTFYFGTNVDLYHNWQTTPNGQWVVETPLPRASARQVALILQMQGSQPP